MKRISFLAISCLFFLFACDKSTNPEENATWRLQRDKQNDITYYSIFFSDKNNGWIVGYNGTIEKTTNS